MYHLITLCDRHAKKIVPAFNAKCTKAFEKFTSKLAQELANDLEGSADEVKTALASVDSDTQRAVHSLISRVPEHVVDFEALAEEAVDEWALNLRFAERWPAFEGMLTHFCP